MLKQELSSFCGGVAFLPRRRRAARASDCRVHQRPHRSVRVRVRLLRAGRRAVLSGVAGGFVSARLLVQQRQHHHQQSGSGGCRRSSCCSRPARRARIVSVLCIYSMCVRSDLFVEYEYIYRILLYFAFALYSICSAIYLMRIFLPIRTSLMSITASLSTIV